MTSCKTTFPSTESLSQGTGAKSGEGNAEGWSHPTLNKSMGFSCGYGQKERRIHEVLSRFPEGK